MKTALDARALNNSIAKDKYQMPNLENLMDMIAETLDGKEEKSMVFLSRHEICVLTSTNG